jgi:hypothetical protein
VPRKGQARNAYRILIGESGKGPVRRMRRCEDNLNIKLSRDKIVKLGGGLNWLRIVSNDGLWY